MCIFFSQAGRTRCQYSGKRVCCALRVTVSNAGGVLKLLKRFFLNAS